MPEAWQILWSGPAQEDLRQIKAWVERDSLASASRLAQSIRGGIDKLAVFPSSGRVVPEIGIDRYREVVVSPYRIIYEVREHDLVILRIWHSRRELPEG